PPTGATAEKCCSTRVSVPANEAIPRDVQAVPVHTSYVGDVTLTKSLFTAGQQCHKLLWWKVHEPMAVELQPDKVLQDRFAQGAQVGALARALFSGGTFIDLPHNAYAARVQETRRAVDAGATAIFEASFVANDVFVAV